MSPPSKTKYPNYSNVVKIPNIFEIIIRFWIQEPSFTSIFTSSILSRKNFWRHCLLLIWYPVISVTFRIQQSKSPNSKVAMTTANPYSIHRWLQMVMWLLFFSNMYQPSPRHLKNRLMTTNKEKNMNAISSISHRENHNKNCSTMIDVSSQKGKRFGVWVPPKWWNFSCKGEPMKIPLKSKQQQCLKKIRACFEIVFPLAIGSFKIKMDFPKNLLHKRFG